jgi:iron complex outermembrane receptor protein
MNYFCFAAGRSINSRTVQVAMALVFALLTHSLSVNAATSDAAGADGASTTTSSGAETPQASDKETAAAEDKLETVKVIARRREEDVQSIPESVFVVSAQAIDDNNIHAVGDLQDLVPALKAGTGLTRDALDLSIRGQGSDSGGGRPGVVAYVNEVPIPSTYDGQIPGGPGLLFDLENIQVLEGPQGTLFGRNSVGGDLLLQTARPTDQFGGRFQIEYGNYNDRAFDGAINIPIISDTLLTRFAATGQLRDGFTWVEGDPIHPHGFDADNRQYWGIRGTVTLHASEAVQNDFIATLQKFDSNGSPLFLSAVDPNGAVASVYPAILGLLAQQQALGVRTALPVDSSLRSAGSMMALNDILRWQLSENITFRNILGYVYVDQILDLDLDGTDLPILDVPDPARNLQDRQVSEEAQLLGKAWDKLTWQLGLFYLDDAPTIPTQIGAAGKVGYQCSTIFGGFSCATEGTDTRSRAVYAQGDYDLSAIAQGLKVTAGVRRTRDDYFEVDQGCNSATPTQLCQPSAGAIVYAAGSSNSAWTYTGSLQYQLASAALIYATYSRGFRAGGYNFSYTPGVPNPPPYGPEYVGNIELGIKSDGTVAGMPFRTNLAVYYQDYSDIQATISALGNGVYSEYTANAAKAKLYGAELEETIRPTRNLQLGASVDYLRFNYVNFDIDVPASEAASLLDCCNAGRIPWKATISARYRIPLSAVADELVFNVHSNWQAKSGDYTYPTGAIDSYALLNLSVDANRIVGEPLGISLFASNVLNKVYSIGGIPGYYPEIGYSVVRYGEPRMYGIRLRYDFGSR